MPQKREDVVMDSIQSNFSSVLCESEQVLRQCFKEYSLDEVFLSFNGGKDCTVLLDIVLNMLTQSRQRCDVASELKVVYIRTSSPFREMEDFVQQTEKHYGLNIIVTEGDMKEALKHILEEDKRLKACLMGTRRTDPYSADLNFMQKTDGTWPPMLRVSPLLNWSYHQIWSYIREKNVPYCSLYDEGYTSIGSTSNTSPNPALAIPNRLIYAPAWKLSDPSLERAGRVTQSKTQVYSLPESNGHTTDRDSSSNGVA